MSGPTAYRLLDSGHGRKLEQIGPVRVERQAATAWWRPRLGAAQWKDVDLVHHRSEKGGGHWETRRAVPAEWVVAHGGVELIAKATPFGHLGVFAEHAGQWCWLRERIGARRAARPEAEARPRILNLFAYTGGATLACARAGAQVTHVDAARGVVDWARRNAERNRLGNDAVQWIVDDALAFTAREVRRGRRYDGVILDPPSFGRGSGKQVWKIEEQLPALLAEIARLLAPEPLLVLLSAHTPGFGPIALSNLLDEALAAHPRASLSEEGEMLVEDSSGRRLPSGTFARRGFALVSPPSLR